MLRSLATCVSAEMFISLSCAMSMVAAPSGRSGATNFFELIGGFFSLCGIVNSGLDFGKKFFLSCAGYRRECNYLLRFYCLSACSERLVELVTGNLIGLGQNNRVRNPVMIEPHLHGNV